MCRRFLTWESCSIVFALGALIRCFCSAFIIACRKEASTLAIVLGMMTPFY